MNKQLSSSEKLAILDSRKNFYYSKKHKLPLKRSKNYFLQYELTSNKFFDANKHNGIVVYQSSLLGYCEHYKVIKYHQYNPFDSDNIYLDGFNNNLLSRSLTVYENSLSILGKFLYRLGRYFKFTDTSMTPMGEKASFPHLLKKLENSLDTENSNLFFAHFSVPHKPFGFDENCKYDGGRQYGGGEKKLHPITEEEQIVQHNVERNCVVYYLDIFLGNLKKKEYWEDLEIVIMSDHGARITLEEERLLSVIFAIKTKKMKLHIDTNQRKKVNLIFVTFFWSRLH